MRILGVDYGSKRMGIAITDDLEMLAHPLKVVSHGSAIKEIIKIITEYDVKKIIVGMPYNNKDQIAFKAKEVIKWIETLEKQVETPIETFDERFTTFDAEEMLIKLDKSRKKRAEIIDMAAAQSILQGYLNVKKEIR